MLGRSVLSNNTTSTIEEELVGIKNGINLIFSISHTPIAETFNLYLNGIKLQDTEYELDSTIITLSQAPQSDDSLICTYGF